MTHECFVDSSGFFALLAPRDAHHADAQRHFRQIAAQRRQIVTTDYVLDETATLLKKRGHGHLASSLFDYVFASAACRVEWTDQQRFDELRAYFRKHSDQAWSFTDCLSFLVMRQLRLREALTTDRHFEQAGFVALLK